MNKNLFLNGLKILITLGLLCSLVVPAATMAQAPVTKTIKQDTLGYRECKTGCPAG